MTFNEYQKQALTTAHFTGDDMLDLSHWTLGLTGESGEVAEKVKKIIRDKSAHMTPELKLEIVKEAGDVLWYLAVLAKHLDVSFEDVADLNLSKLRSRKERQTLHGEGDNR